MKLPFNKGKKWLPRSKSSKTNSSSQHVNPGAVDQECISIETLAAYVVDLSIIPDGGPPCIVCKSFSIESLPIRFRFGDRKPYGTGCVCCDLVDIILRTHRFECTTHSDSSCADKLTRDTVIAVDQVSNALVLGPESQKSWRCKFRVAVKIQPIGGSSISSPWPLITHWSSQYSQDTKTLLRSYEQKISQAVLACANHAACTTYREALPRCPPARLLKIRNPRSIGSPLCMVQDLDVVPEYACLSHCWGSGVSLQTTTNNLEAHLTNGVTWDALPLTFKHAVALALLIGLDYIWIDSLCIVQNDVSDWRREGSKMAGIYSGAKVTLAATGAANSSVGLIQDVPWLVDQVPLRTYSSVPGPEPFDFRLLYLNLESNKVRSTTLSSAPLHSRAWFLQEYMLSPLVVQFIGGLLHVSCLEKSACEIDYETLNLGIEEKSSTWLRTGEDCQPGWYSLVGSYTSCNITFAKDKLPALQGMAKAMKDRRRCNYYAGLWEDTLIQDLTWSVDIRVTGLKELQTYRAPSWSWASRPDGRVIRWLDYYGGYGMVEYETSIFTIESMVVSVHTTPAGDDPLGEIIGGSLTLESVCVRCSIVSEDATSSFALLDDGEKVPLSWFPDANRPTSEYTDNVLVLLGRYFFGYIIFMVVQRGNNDDTAFRRVGLVQTKRSFTDGRSRTQITII